MKQQQIFLTTISPRNGVGAVLRTRRFVSSSLIGLSVTVVLSLLQLLILSFVRFSALLATHPVIVVIPIIEWIAATFVVFLVTKPLAIMSYVRAVHRVQTRYHALYTPLTAVTNIRRAADPDMQDDAGESPMSEDEQVSILDLVQQPDVHQLILGMPGAGKTTALRVYQYSASQNPWSFVFSREQIPIYIPMKNYSLFLKSQQGDEGVDVDAPEQGQVALTLVAYLLQSDFPGMRSLRPYIVQLFGQGRLLFLCDGLNEIDRNYLSEVSEELVYMMRQTQNRFVMTCREVDYREQPDFVQLVEEGQAARAVIYPLQPEQVSQFVERYVEKQNNQWKHTAGQIMQVIDRSRLRYHCTNPMMLFTLMGIIDTIGVERGKQIDTRGRLLHEYVRQLVINEQSQPRWSREQPDEQDVIIFLSEIACAARWANDRNAIQLRVSPSSFARGGGSANRAVSAELVEEIQAWLSDHPARGPFDTDALIERPIYNDAPLLLQFALSAALIEISTDGVLSFPHELIAEYFVAEYFFASAPHAESSLAVRADFLEDVPRWSEPVAIWAGLADDPLELADRFGSLGVADPSSVIQALTLGLVCVGVLWAPPQAEVQQQVVLPASVEKALGLAVRTQSDREELAHIFTRAAEEGGQEVYRSLLTLITVDGIDELVLLLDHTIVTDLLFVQLEEAVDRITYDQQVKRIVRVLGRLGGSVIDRAAQYCLPAPERSVRFRAAAMNILGGTGDLRAVDPLIERLRDAESFIIGRATNALIRLGPVLTMNRVLEELDNRASDAMLVYIHHAILTILNRFMDEQDASRQLSLAQYQQILEHLLPVLSSQYQSEPDVQHQALEIFVRQGRNATRILSPDVQDNRWDKAIDSVVGSLASSDECTVQNAISALKEIGSPAVPRLLASFDQTSEILRGHVIDILGTIRDQQALPQLLRLLEDPSPLIQQKVALALRAYAPESIVGVISSVLHGPNDAVADRGVQILVSIGEPVVQPVIQAISTVVPGRTRFLVQVLALVHDVRAVAALILLLDQPQLEPLLVIAIIRALCQFQDQRVVTPLLRLLSMTNPQIYEETITALSMLGSMALAELVDALDIEQETVVAQRVRRAILGISPFVGEQLIAALERSHPVQAEQIMLVFKMRGRDAAPILVKHILHPKAHVRTSIQDALKQMPGSIVVPALLAVLSQPKMLDIVCTFLLYYPDESVAPLVDLLGDNERGPIAENLLPQFGERILRPLLIGLDELRSLARERAQRVIVALVHQQKQAEERENVLREVVRLFYPIPPARAREALLDILTGDLSEYALPILLEGLSDAQLVGDVSDAFARLVRQPALQNRVLDRLIDALFVDEQRPGAEIALIRIGDLAVTRVGDLIIHTRASIARAAKDILCEIGVPALSFIWMAYSDRSNSARREAARAIFRSMPPEVIKDELISLLVSDDRDKFSMATSLLVERIDDETTQMEYSERVMVPELIDYVLTHHVHETNLRIIALLLLTGEPTIIDHLLQALEGHPHYDKALIYVFLLFGDQMQELLLNVVDDTNVPAELRADISGVVSMQVVSDRFIHTVRDISTYGLASSNRNGSLYSDQLTIALRTLGGLLASGQWNARKILELRDAAPEDDPLREIFNVLLGWLYEPQIARLQRDIDAQRESFKKQMMTMTAEMAEMQQRASSLEKDLEKARAEHGQRRDELQEITHEKEMLKVRFDKLNSDHIALKAIYDKETKERARLAAQVSALRKQQVASEQGMPSADVASNSGYSERISRSGR